ncbi:MAG: nucleotidyltransferase family protein [Thermoflexales bacterium]
MNKHVAFSRERLAAFRQKHSLRRLAIFASALRDDFRPDGDVDVLVEFEPDRIPTLLQIAAIFSWLSVVLDWKQVSLSQLTTQEVAAQDERAMLGWIRLDA